MGKGLGVGGGTEELGLSLRLRNLANGRNERKKERKSKSDRLNKEGEEGERFQRYAAFNPGGAGLKRRPNPTYNLRDAAACQLSGILCCNNNVVGKDHW